jgi:hypothetical protein
MREYVTFYRGVRPYNEFFTLNDLTIEFSFYSTGTRLGYQVAIEL